MLKRKQAETGPIKLTTGDRVFYAVNTILLALLALIVIYPLYFIIIASFSDPDAVLAGQVILYPVRVTFDMRRQSESAKLLLGDLLHHQRVAFPAQLRGKGGDHEGAEMVIHRHLPREERDVLHVKLLLHGLFMGQLIVTELHGFSQDQLSGRLLYGAAVVEHL